MLLGAPVLAAENPTPPTPTYDVVSVAPAGETVQQGWTSAPTPVDASLVGVKWEGDPNTKFTVEVRSTGGEWTKPTPIEGGNETDRGTQDAAGAASVSGSVSDPVWVGEDATAVRVAVTSGAASDVSLAAVDAAPATAPSGSAGALGGIVPRIDGPGRYAFAIALFALAALLVAFAFGLSPWRSRRARRVIAIGALSALGLTACVPIPDGSTPPFIHGRAEWGAQQFGTGPAPCPGGPEYANSLRFAVVHHTVNSNNYSEAQVPAMIRSIQEYHMNANGYCDIAYNFVVDRFGGVWEARDGGITNPVIGGHAGGFNYGSVGVALLGNYQSVQPSGAEWNSLVHLLRWRLSAARVDPTQGFWQTVASSPCNCQRFPVGSSWFFGNAIVWHQTVDYTECPGNAFAPRLAELQSAVQAGIVIPPLPPAPTVPTSTTTTSTTTTTTTTTLAPTTTTT